MPRILLVEDNEMNRDMLSRRLQRRGFEILWAGTGREAIHMAQSEKPDLVLMDMSLPEMDGWQATRVIRASPETTRLPVIALTAHAMAGDRDKALKAGCDEFESKPVDMESLLRKIGTLLERAGNA